MTNETKRFVLSAQMNRLTETHLSNHNKYSGWETIIAIALILK